MEEKHSFSPEFLEKLKAKNDLVSVVSKYVRLEKKGKNYWGCCPFHHEKTPSFAINEYEQFYHCFGCGESGDVISFLMKYENLSYPEAIETLAKNAGMEVPKFSNDEEYLKKKKIKDKNLEILNLTRDFYKQELYKPTAKPAQEYIKKRKVTTKELENFELGFSPDFNTLPNFLKSKGFLDIDLKNAGVCEISDKKKIAYDFLAGRLVFPIANTNGDCIGFSGRDLTGQSQMKYKNTSATLTFDKSRTVYAINLIKKFKQQQHLDNIIIVEGQFDVIMMHKFGFENTVACMGTAITTDHIRELKRFSDNVILCLDGDAAGIKATLRAISIFEKSDLNTKIAILPNGQDPDEFLQANGTEGMKKLLENSVTMTSFKIFLAKEKYNLNKIDEKSKFLKETLFEISKLSSKSEQMVYLNEIKNLTNISLDILQQDIQIATPIQKSTKEEPLTFPPELNAESKATKFVLASMLFAKDFVNFNFDFEPYLQNNDYKKLYNLIMDKHKNNQKLIISNIFHVFGIPLNKNLDDIINYNFEVIENAEEYYKQCLWSIIEKNLKFRKDVLGAKYKEETNQEEKKNILQEIDKINKELQQKNKIIGEM